jgi:hypothetical protein
MFMRDSINDSLLQQFAYLMALLKEEEQKGLVYAIVGGAALSAWSEEQYEPVRENGTVRDIDIVVLADPAHAVPALRSRLEADSTFEIPVDFNVVKDRRYKHRFQLLSHFKQHSDNRYSIIFRDVEYLLPEAVTELHEVAMRTSEGLLHFKTFNPHTLAHLYIHRVGSLKRKDITKVRAFIRRLHSQGSGCTEHCLYRIFHVYSKQLRVRYPFYSLFMRLYNYLDRTMFNSLLSHKFIPRGMYRTLIGL